MKRQSSLVGGCGTPEPCGPGAAPCRPGAAAPGAGGVPGTAGAPPWRPSPCRPPPPKPPCMHRAPNCSAFRTPSQCAAGCGGFQRSSPTGGAAYGIPLKTRTSAVVAPAAPETKPASVRMVSGIAADIIALAATRAPVAMSSDKRFMNLSLPKSAEPRLVEILRPGPLMCKVSTVRHGPTFTKSAIVHFLTRGSTCQRPKSPSRPAIGSIRTDD